MTRSPTKPQRSYAAVTWPRNSAVTGSSLPSLKREKGSGSLQDQARVYESEGVLARLVAVPAAANRDKGILLSSHLEVPRAPGRHDLGRALHHDQVVLVLARCRGLRAPRHRQRPLVGAVEGNREDSFEDGAHHRAGHQLVAVSVDGTGKRRFIIKISLALHSFSLEYDWGG